MMPTIFSNYYCKNEVKYLFQRNETMVTCEESIRDPSKLQSRICRNMILALNFNKTMTQNLTLIIHKLLNQLPPKLQLKRCVNSRNWKTTFGKKQVHDFDFRATFQSWFKPQKVCYFCPFFYINS